MRHKPYEISIPTPSGRTQAMYLRGDERERCIVLVNAPAYAESPALARALKGTAAMTRRAGMNILSLPYQTEVSRAVFDTLGALRVLVAWGTRRVVLLMPAEYRAALIGDEALHAILAQLQADATALDGGAAKVLPSIQSLAEITPRLLQSVAGLGSIACMPSAERAVTVQIDCRLHPLTDDVRQRHWSLHSEGDRASDTQRQVRDVLIHWVTAALYGIELSWRQMNMWLRGRTQLHAGDLPLPEMDPAIARRVPDESAHATFRLALFWLDQQLDRVVTHFGTRDLELARLARQRLDAAPALMNPYRKAQLIWPALDYDAQHEWLCACSSLSRAATFSARTVASGA